MAAIDERWETCLHEAAHCVVARVCNSWNAGCSAMVFESGGGLARLPRGLSDFAAAVAVAAGDHGARLAATFPRPRKRCKPPVPRTATAEKLRAAAVAEEARNVYRTACREWPDDLATARFCCEKYPTEPREWARTFYRIHGAAKRLTWRHREEIATAARTLFHAGSVSIPGDAAHEAIFTPPAEQRAITTPPPNKEQP